VVLVPESVLGSSVVPVLGSLVGPAVVASVVDVVGDPVVGAPVVWPSVLPIVPDAVSVPPPSLVVGVASVGGELVPWVVLVPVEPALAEAETLWPSSPHADKAAATIKPERQLEGRTIVMSPPYQDRPAIAAKDPSIPPLL